MTVAKASGSTQPIDDIFEAIKTQTNAASPSGAWGPSGATPVPKAKRPDDIQKIVERWEQSGDSVAVSTYSVSGKPVYMLDQYTDFGTFFGLYDENGKAIELKEDVENAKRNTERTQAKYFTPFSAPEFKNWKDAIQKTDIGVLIDFGSKGSRSDPETSRAMSPEMTSAFEAMKASIGDGRFELFHNRRDKTYLLVGDAIGGTKGSQYALFTNAGTPLKSFKISGE